MFVLELTIYASLELLTADFAREFSDAGFLVQLDGNRFLVIAEKAWEIRWKRLFLNPGSSENAHRATGLQHQPFSALAVFERTFCVSPMTDQN